MYIYEMHQHTSGCSRCAEVSPGDMVLSVKKSGFSGVVVTNHFYHGNTSVDRALPWAEFCAAYREDYLAAKRAGEELGIDVIYGLEENVGNGKEVLLYGIDPDLIGKYPELEKIDLPHLSEIVRSAGGLVVQAHPFRARPYIKDPDALLDPAYLDGYEVYNKGNAPDENEKALALAERTGLLKTAGSDSHSPDTSCRFGIEAAGRITSESELANVLKSGDYRLFYNADF